MSDFKFAIRQLLKNPGFTAVAVITLALGIGINTAIFSVMNAVLLRSLPYPEPERMIQVWSRRLASNNLRARSSLPNFIDWKTQNRSFSSLAYYRLADFHFTATDDPIEVRTGRVSEEFFDVLALPPFLGRTFLPEENIPGRDHVVVLGHRIWMQRFGGDREVIGRTVGLEGKEYVVCGVMPPQFRFPEAADIWVPYALTPDQIGNKRSDHFNLVIGRLRDNISLQQAQQDLHTIASRLEKEFPDANEGMDVFLAPLPEDLVGEFKPALILLLGAVGAVLAIACANIANLQLVRGIARRKEIAVRAALGAARGRIVWQLLLESMLLALLGGTLGIILAYWGLDVLIALAPPDVPRINETKLDGTVLLGSFVLSVVTGMAFGLFPAIAASQPDLVEHLKDGSKGSTNSGSRRHSRNALVVAEIALAAVLLVGATMLLQSFQNLNRAPLGFDSSDLATIRVSLPWSKYHVTRKDKPFFRQLYRRLQEVGGVQDLALVCALPIADRQTTVWAKEVGVAFEPGKEPVAGFNYVTPSYFQTMRIPIMRGRNLTVHDTDNTLRVVVVDETLARQHYPNVDPLGKRLLIEGQGSEPFTIVGIAGGVRQRHPSRPPSPQLYLHYQQINEGTMWVVIRGATVLRGLEKALAREVHLLDADQSTGPFRTMEQHIGESSRLARFRTLLLGLLAALALVLAIVGIYSVIAYSVTQRTRELGLRIALGAKRASVLRLVVNEGGRLAFAGVLLGIILSLVLARILDSMLFDVNRSDPLPFLLVAASLILAALLASYIPARRAARVDPMVALRYE